MRSDLYFTKEQLKDFKSHYDKAVEECENLREKYLGLKEQNDSNIVQLNTVNEQLDQLKAENDELKGTRDRNFLATLEERKRADKLCKTLTEIKEIAQNVIKNVSDRCIETTPMYGIHKQILQKISEVEDESNI